MADISDIQDAIAAIVSAAMYPHGIGQAPAVLCPMVRIYAGWPQSSALDKDMRTKAVNVSVFGEPGGKNTTRYAREWREITRQENTITATVASNTATLSGTVATPQNVGAYVNGRLFAYAVQPGDTLTTIATALAALINAVMPASSSGAVISANGLQQIVVGRSGVLARETRRQEKRFRVSVWAPTDELRRAAGRIVDDAISPLDQLALIDGSYGRVSFAYSNDVDEGQEALIYRRDIVFSIDYPTLQFTDGTAVLGSTLGISAYYFLGGTAYAQFETTIVSA